MNTRMLIAPRKTEFFTLNRNALDELQLCLNEKRYEDGVLTARTSLQLEPANLSYKKCLAFCLGQIGELHEAKAVWMELIEDDPFSEEYLLNLSDIEKRLNRLDSAIGLLMLATEYHPESVKPWISLGECHAFNNDSQGSVNASLEVLKRQPNNTDAYQNLGSGFFGLAMFDQAKYAFETALLLNPHMQEAKSSLSAVLYRQNQEEAAAALLEELICKHQTTDRMPLSQLKWNAALIQLRLGNLQKGWSYYEEGLKPEVQGVKVRHPHRTFQVPRWTPQSPVGQTVLVWREQGIGDDVIFMTCLQELIDVGYKPLVECDARMIDLIQRSFPTVKAREAIYRIEYPNDSPYNDYDLHLPMGSLMKYFRPDLDSFDNKAGAYLKVDLAKKAMWLERLEKIRNGKKLVGITWRGGLTDAVGQMKYSKLMNWAPLLSSEEFVFVNLQFGECAQELQEVESALGIHIHRWSDLDLKNDLDDVCALISCLDDVVTISSAVWAFSAALGARTSLLLSAPHWTMFNQEHIPFFSSVTCFCADNNSSMASVLPQIKHHLLQP
jgi:tetratricopeptide (TPR) repeat protein